MRSWRPFLFWPVVGLIFGTFLCAGVSSAQTIPHGLTKSMCQSGVTIKSSGSIWSAADGKTAYTQLIGSTNFCTNETVTLVGFLGNVLQDDITCICTNKQQYDSVGCGQGQTQPTVTTIIARSKTDCAADSITISKCVADPEAAYQQACSSGQSMPIVPATSQSAAASPVTLAPTPQQRLGTQVDPLLTSPFTASQNTSLTPAAEPPLTQNALAPSYSSSSAQPSNEQTPNAQSPSPYGTSASPVASTIPDGPQPTPTNVGAIDEAPPATPADTAAQSQNRTNGALASAPALQQSQQISSNLFAQQGLFTMLISALKSLLQVLFSSSAQIAQTASPPPATFSFTVEPQTVLPDGAITVSWTSSGMLTSAPCTVSRNGTAIGSGIAGSLVAYAPISTSSSPIVFAILCDGASNGQLYQQAQNVIVQ